MTSRVTRSAVFALLLLFSTAPLFAEWYDDYADGLAAAKKGQWQVVVDKMSAAIAKKPKEDDRARSYGAVFVAYHPYYYRGAAYFQLGQYQKASDDLGKATGMGDVKLQSLDRLQMDVQAKLTQPTNPPPTNTVAPPPPKPPTNTAPSLPVQPTFDAALEQAKQRGNAAINQATASQNAATSGNATTLAPAVFIQATVSLGQAQTRAASARSTADWQEVALLADKARGQFDQSLSQAKIAAAHQQPSRPTTATVDVLKEEKSRVHRALEDYFNGRYETASREFQSLASNELQQNALIWTFLGASQYSQYYLGGEQAKSLRDSAEASFRHARALRRNLTDLPKQYFSPRIRRFYKTIQ